ncbi:MAG TPA: hypothetical protein PKE40_11155 [Arachnia sp.]|nr:hypothetical protein [Arachnia sp.]HMT86901.1 hypothetical protein [Arachnia sp.]
MKRIAIIAGACAVVAYALWGTVAINDLGLVAGSGLSRDATIAAMKAAGQPASMIPGFLFLAAGVAIAGAWALFAHRRSEITPGWIAAGWCVALVLGTPAYFFASFWNVNALGDTFYDWHAEAVADLARPLHLISAIALIGLSALAARRLATRPASASPRAPRR